jgi:hypothetical protein
MYNYFLGPHFFKFQNTLKALRINNLQIKAIIFGAVAQNGLRPLLVHKYKVVLVILKDRIASGLHSETGP